MHTMIVVWLALFYIVQLLNSCLIYGFLLRNSSCTGHKVQVCRGVARNIERGFLNVCARENNINIHNLSAKLRVVSGLYLHACNTCCNSLDSSTFASVFRPDPAHDPIASTEIMLGIDWINDLETQAFLIQLKNKIVCKLLTLRKPISRYFSSSSVCCHYV